MYISNDTICQKLTELLNNLKHSSQPHREIDMELLKSQIEHISKDGSLHTFELSDLVMIQMVGDMDKFLHDINNGIKQEDIYKIIEEARDSSTTLKLFPGIVNKTIEAQFGDKHATLRELGQNAMDSYASGKEDKMVVFHTEDMGPHIALFARDYGCGMSLKSLIRDLLVPYNSGKEFDPTKIGEHGIGWYSIVDIADLVKVTTWEPGQLNGSQALVYRQDNIWKTTIQPKSNNGFHPNINASYKVGTEICAYIPKKNTNITNIKSFLYRYLGMIDPFKAEILFNDIPVNIIREKYQKGSPSFLTIGNETGDMLMACSKRRLRGKYPSGADDVRFKHRDEHFESILLTQRGLFVNYLNVPFAEHTMHREFFNDLSRIGVDFWVDLPENVTLTKGRNSIIADHVAPTVQAMYSAFENLYLDVVLNDQDVVEHSSDRVLIGIAKVFERSYYTRVRQIEKRRYSFWRRFTSNIMWVLNGVAKALIILASFLTEPFLLIRRMLRKVKSFRLKHTSMEKDKTLFFDIQGFFKKINWPYLGVITFRVTLILGLLAAASYGCYLLHKYYGWVPFIEAAKTLGVIVATSTVGYLLCKIPSIVFKHCKKAVKDIKEILKYIAEDIKKIVFNLNFSNPFKGVGFDKKDFCGNLKISQVILNVLLFSFKSVRALLYITFVLVSKLLTPLVWVCRLFKKTGEWIFGFTQGIFDKFGLFQDMETKRENKRSKQRQKISKKYLAKMHKDKFFDKIMHKKIIRATAYVSENDEKNQKKPGSIVYEALKDTVREIVRGDIFNFDNKHNYQNDYQHYYARRTPTGTTSKKDLKKVEIKISIDTMIDLFLRDKIECNKSGSAMWAFKASNGSVLVDYNNPLVSTIIDKLDLISNEVKNKYDVKILEDHLRSVARASMGLFLILYFFSFIGVAHMLISLFLKDVRNPFANTSAYKKFENRFTRFYNVIIKERIIQRSVIGICKGIGFLISNAPKFLVSLFVKTVYLTFYYLWKIVKFLVVKVTWVLKTIALGLIILVDSLGKAIVFLGKTINPTRYPAYVDSLSRWLQKKFRRVKRSLTKIIDHSNSLDEQEKKDIEEFQTNGESKRKKSEGSVILKAIKNIGESIWSKVLHAYESSFLWYLFGYGVVTGDGFREMRKSKLETIVKTTGTSLAYLHMMNVLEKLEDIVSKALGKSSYKFLFTCRDPQYFPQISGVYDTKMVKGLWAPRDYKETHGLITFHPKKKNILMINIAASGDFMSPITKPRVWTSKGKEQKEALALRLLDMLIHMRTHEKEKNKDDTYHKLNFFNSKDEIRRKVTAYLLDHHPDLNQIVEQDLPFINREQSPFYYVPKEELATMFHMTLRRLKKEKDNYDKKFAEIQAKKERERRERLAKEKAEKEAFKRTMSSYPSALNKSAFKK